jgi:uncharacterized protein
MILALTLLAQAVPPPAEQVTADCARPIYATDQLVCRDAELRALDLQLAQSLTAFDAAPSPWLEAQSAWFKRRSRCAFQADHRTCAVWAYRERLKVVTQWPMTVRPIRAACSDRLIDSLAIEPDRIGFFVRGRLAGVALTGVQPPWQPYLSASSARRQVKAQGPAGRLRCTAKR